MKVIFTSHHLHYMTHEYVLSYHSFGNFFNINPVCVDAQTFLPCFAIISVDADRQIPPPHARDLVKSTRSAPGEIIQAHTSMVNALTH